MSGRASGRGKVNGGSQRALSLSCCRFPLVFHSLSEREKVELMSGGDSLKLSALGDV